MDGEAASSALVSRLPQECPKADAGVVVETTAFGGWLAGPELGLGFRQSRYACLPPGCHLVVWAEPGTDIAALREVLNDLDQACLIE
ncbi:MAG: hypothetical protein AAGE18_05830 [Pseudomonadota bacterium]